MATTHHAPQLGFVSAFFCLSLVGAIMYFARRDDNPAKASLPAPVCSFHD